ncbi:MAG TPA: polysaccharide biosynthesis C-terminal domain-containing protein [Candidatus Elarobacter sp.]
MIDRLRRDDLVAHGAVVFAGAIAANAGNYLYYMLAGRVVGVEQYGELTALASAVLALGAPASVAQIVIARVAADLHARGDGAAADALLRRVTAWGGFAFAVLGAIAIACAEPVARYLQLSSGLPVVASAVALAGYGLATVQRGVLQGTHRFGSLSASYSLESGVRVALGIWLATRFGALGALAGFALAELASVAFHGWVFRRALRPGPPAAFDRAGLTAIVSGVGAIQLTLAVLVSSYDVVIVRHVFDPATAGLYAAASLAGRIVPGVLGFIPTVLMPKVAARAHARRSAARLLGAALAAGGATAAGALLIAIVAPGTVAALIAGPAFRPAAGIVPIYVAASGFLGLATVVAAYQIGLHRYAFVVPGVVVGAAEIAAIALWHPGITAVAWLLAAGHAALFAVTFIGIGATAKDDRAAPADR